MDDFEGAGFKVDVGPTQPEQLPTTKAEAESEDVERAEWLVVGRGEDGAGLRPITVSESSTNLRP